MAVAEPVVGGDSGPGRVRGLPVGFGVFDGGAACVAPIGWVPRESRFGDAPMVRHRTATPLLDVEVWMMPIVTAKR